MTRYEENFKQMIIELNQTGRSVRGLAKEYGLSEATILPNDWMAINCANLLRFDLIYLIDSVFH
ncbi:transposase [Enterococcus lactis]